MPASKTVSGKYNLSSSDVPGLISGNTIIPSPSPPAPISAALQIIPADNSPRISRDFITPPPTTAPGGATTTCCPSATFGAPQTMFVFSPVSTSQTRSLSALECARTEHTFPATSPRDDKDSNDSTSMPRAVNNADNDSSSGNRSGGKKSKSQRRENFMRPKTGTKSACRSQTTGECH